MVVPLWVSGRGSSDGVHIWLQVDPEAGSACDSSVHLPHTVPHLRKGKFSLDADGSALWSRIYLVSTLWTDAEAELHTLAT